MTIIKGTDPRIPIKIMNDALARIGLTLPEAVTTTAPTATVAEPDSAEIAAAIQAAKGDPASDKTVQRLITAHAIARGGYTDLLARAGQDEQRQALRDALDTINDQIHEKFETAARTLETAGPKIRGYENLDDIILSTVPANQAEPARLATDAQHTLRASVDAWKKLWVHVGGQQQGRPEEVILAVCNPTPSEWHKHSSRRPNSLPAPGDVWTPVRYGWTLTLAHDLRDAKGRAQHIRHAITSDFEEQRIAKGRATGWGMGR